MNYCSQHKKELFRQTDMKVVAKAIADLHYETLYELLFNLHVELRKDSEADYHNKRYRLSNVLYRAESHIEIASIKIREAWEISKPFMKKTKP